MIGAMKTVQHQLIQGDLVADVMVAAAVTASNAKLQVIQIIGVGQKLTAVQQTMLPGAERAKIDY